VKDYLPSKKFVFFIAVLVVTVGVFIAVKTPNTEPSAQKYTGDVIALVAEKDTLYKDTDGDGLYDWEELILKTDPKNPDTNNNGILDGKEYKNKKKYPELTYEDVDMLFGLKRLSKTGGGNITEALTQEAGLRYGLLAQDGAIDKDKLRENIVNGLAKDLPPTEERDIFTEKNITISQNTDTVATNTYTASVLLVFEKYASIYEYDPLALLKEWFETQDEEILKTLTSLATTYKNLSDEIGALKVPAHLVSVHLDLANGLNKTASALSNMATTPTDPIRGLRGGAEYLRNKKNRQNTIVALGTYYTNVLVKN